ncbi:MAG: metal-dependent hydrolase [Planctomycetes bacterium]|nr:metal-dependent hydrolase [Planctomycetota bacterium]
MIDNVHFQSLALPGMTIEGYSRAMVQSVWRVPEWNVGFDVGAMPWHFLDTPNWFITHAHLDHLAALPVLVSRRSIMEFPIPTTIHLPEELVDDVRELLDIWERLDRGPQSCTLKGMIAGDEVSISRDHIVKAYAMRHPVPALGYIVWEVRHKLKEEYQGLPGSAIRDLRQSGVAITEEFRTPLLAYTGDTSPVGLDENPDFFEAKVLITEMSFVRPKHPREKIHSYGHMHIDDFIDRAEKFHNDKVIVGHVSSRYEIDETRLAVRDFVPSPLKERLHVWG